MWSAWLYLDQGSRASKMSLPPLEYTDCLLDSPTFKEIIGSYERELENNANCVKSLVRECRQMIQATEEFSKAQMSFATVLGNFTFQTIGEQTEDEKIITNSLQTISRLLLTIEDYRHHMLSTISVRLLQTLESFRKDQLQKVRDDKKRFDKAANVYHEALQKHLLLSSKKKQLSLDDADSAMEIERAAYKQSAFDYVCKLQDVHAQKQYELIEPIIGYIDDVSTFFHRAYDSALSIKPELHGVRFKVQILRETQENELEKAYQLKSRVIKEGEAGLVHHPEFLRQGNLFVQDSQRKMSIGPQWHRYFGQYRKKEIAGKIIRQIRFIPVGHQGNLISVDFMEVRDCVLTKADECDRRFCFDLELISLHGIYKYTVQAMSFDDREGWLETVESRETIFDTIKFLEARAVNDLGILFVQKCINAIESRGLDQEGLYRSQKSGVSSKASKLVKECIEKGRMDQIDLSEWDTQTIASAVKYYLSKHLEKPLFTFTFHQKFIDAAKISDHEKRLYAIQGVYEQLPESHKELITILFRHLNRVAAMSDFNLMKASNIGVSFGCILMRPELESMAAIVDIKYQNIVVAVMVENAENIFPSGLVSVNPKEVVKAEDTAGIFPGEGASAKRGTSTAPEAKSEDMHHTDDIKEPSSRPPPLVHERKPLTKEPTPLIPISDTATVPSGHPNSDQDHIVKKDVPLLNLPSVKTELPPSLPSPNRKKRFPAVRFPVEDQVKGLQLQLQAAEERAENAEKRLQATKRSNQLAESELQQKLAKAETRVKLFVKDHEGVEKRVQSAEQQLQDMVHQKQSIERELEGKTRELAAHSTEVWKINSKDVTTVRKIGIGGWGAVHEGTVKVAVKELHEEITSPHNVERVGREIKLMAEVRHPNLVAFIGAVLDRALPLIVTELLDMNLRQAYQQNKLQPGNRLLIFKDVARALDYLHQRYEPIIHRDVSAPNVLLQQIPNNQWKGKVSDLGSANFLQQAQTKGEGNILYSPPEVIPRAYSPRRERIPQTTKIDVYSYGVLLCEVATSTFPSEDNYWEMIQSVRRDYPLLHALIEHCTREMPSDRPTMETVLMKLSQEDMPQI